MENQPDTTGLLKAAHRHAERGCTCVPITPGAQAPWVKRHKEELPCICHACAEESEGVVLPSVRMTEKPATIGNYEIALANAEKGYVSIPLLPGTKIPAVKWKRFQTEKPSKELYRAWFAGTRNNLAIITTGLVIFDCDHPEKIERVLQECGDTPYKVRTPRGGMHLGYRARRGVIVGNHVRIKGLPIDIRAENGLAVQPHSRTEHGAYEWLGSGLFPIAELPVATVGWTRTRTRRRMQSIVPVDDADVMVRRARAYMACIEGAISGQRGHDRTMRAAGVLIQKFGLSLEQAWPLFLEWNEQCEPPWSERELLHKLQDAIRLRWVYAKAR